MKLIDKCECVVVSHARQERLINILSNTYGMQVTQSNSPLRYNWTEPMSYYRLLLLDYSIHQSQTDKPGFYGELTKTCKVIMFNVPSNLETLYEAITMGISGTLFTGDSMETFIKGMTSTLSGELWYRRRVLTWALKKHQHQASQPPNSDQEKLHKQQLTSRENDILHHLSTGFTYQQIADILHISVHTVRTHVYRIYKKLDVSNRVEALNHCNFSYTH